MPTQEEVDLYQSPPSFVVGDIVRMTRARMAFNGGGYLFWVDSFGASVPHWSSNSGNSVNAPTFYGREVRGDGSLGDCSSPFYAYPFTPVSEEEAARLRPLIEAHVKPVRKGPPTNHKIGVPKGKLP